MPPQTRNKYKQDNKISCANNSFLSSSSSANTVSKQRNQINNSMALADAGASGNYISVSNKKFIQKLVATDDRTKIAVTVANGEQIYSSHIGQLSLPDGTNIPAHIFPQLNTSLISISSFVDIGYIVTYNNSEVLFCVKNKCIFKGNRDPISKL